MTFPFPPGYAHRRTLVEGWGHVAYWVEDLARRQGAVLLSPAPAAGEAGERGETPDGRTWLVLPPAAAAEGLAAAAAPRCSGRRRAPGRPRPLPCGFRRAPHGRRGRLYVGARWGRAGRRGPGGWRSHAAWGGWSRRSPGHAARLSPRPAQRLSRGLVTWPWPCTPSPSLAGVLATALASFVAIAHAERGFLLLYEGYQVIEQVFHGMTEQESDPYSASLAHQVRWSGEPVYGLTAARAATLDRHGRPRPARQPDRHRRLVADRDRWQLRGAARPAAVAAGQGDPRGRRPRLPGRCRR